MTCKYLGFDTFQMLTKLSEHYDKIEIEKTNDGSKLLTLYKDGKAMMFKGALFASLTQASKPHIEQWRSEQKDFRERLKNDPVGLFESFKKNNPNWNPNGKQ